MKVKGWVKSQWVPEKSDKICTCHVGDQILKFLTPTEKITHISEWASGYLQPWYMYSLLAVRKSPHEWKKDKTLNQAINWICLVHVPDNKYMWISSVHFCISVYMLIIKIDIIICTIYKRINNSKDYKS